MTQLQLFISVLIAAFGTVMCRALPFMLFHTEGRTPLFIQWIGERLPQASMAMLVVYCFKDVSFVYAEGWIPTVFAGAVTVITQVRLKNIFVSISAGTVSYMVLLRLLS